MTCLHCGAEDPSQHVENCPGLQTTEERQRGRANDKMLNDLSDRLANHLIRDGVVGSHFIERVARRARTYLKDACRAWLPPSMSAKNAEQLAQRFHETYERLAPDFGYQTREASAKPWADVPAKNKALMIAVCADILGAERRFEYRLTGLFDTLRGRYPGIITIEDGLDRTADEREKLRKALEPFAALLDKAGLENVGGGTLISPEIKVQLVKDAQAALELPL